MISVTQINKTFGKIRAVDGVTFSIGSGEIVGFIGPNGAGKSSTMRCITGFFSPDSGQIKIGDFDMLQNRLKAQAQIGYLPESAALYMQMSVIDSLRFVGQMHGMSQQALDDRLRIVIAQCQLKNVLLQQIGTLSKGFRQRVGLAQALLHDPSVLVLDEPTVGLDPVQIREVRQVIRDLGNTKTILLSTHILSEVEALCTRIIMICRGKIVLDQPTSEVVKKGLEKTFMELAEGMVS